MKTKSIIFLILAVLLGIYGVLLLVSEPTVGDIYDSVIGILVMKGQGITQLVVSVLLYGAIDEEDRNRIESWIKLHF